MAWLVCVLIAVICGYTLRGYLGDSHMMARMTEPSDPIEIFLNDPSAFRDFLYDKKTTKAIAASPTTRRILTENGDTANALLGDNKRIYPEVKNQALADKAIALLKNNPVEFTRFFKDPQVASKIVETVVWEAFKLQLSF